LLSLLGNLLIRLRVEADNAEKMAETAANNYNVAAEKFEKEKSIS